MSRASSSDDDGSVKPAHKFSLISNDNPSVDSLSSNRPYSFGDVSSSLWMSSRVAVCDFPTDRSPTSPVSLRRGAKPASRPERLPQAPGSWDGKIEDTTKALRPLPLFHANRPPANVLQSQPCNHGEGSSPAPTLQETRNVVVSEPRPLESTKQAADVRKLLWHEEPGCKISMWEYYRFKLKAPLRSLSKKLRQTRKPKSINVKADHRFDADIRFGQRKLEAVHGKAFSPKQGTTHIERLPGTACNILQPTIDAVGTSQKPTEEFVDIEVTSWLDEMSHTREDLAAGAETTHSSFYSDCDIDASAMPRPLKFPAKRKPAPGPIRRQSRAWI